MKIFISQKMRDKTHEEIWKECERIKSEWVKAHLNDDLSELEFIEPFLLNWKATSDINELTNDLIMLDEADIVLVPKKAKENVTVFTVKILNWNSEFSLLRGCEFEFLIAKSYGKKVYTYNENYTFEEV